MAKQVIKSKSHIEHPKEIIRVHPPLLSGIYIFCGEEGWGEGERQGGRSKRRRMSVLDLFVKQ